MRRESAPEVVKKNKGIFQKECSVVGDGFPMT